MNKHSNRLLNRITSEQARVAVVGLGYVGLPLLIDFVQAGLSVTGIDIDRAKIDRLKARDPDVHHLIAAAEEIAAHLQKGTLVSLESTTYPGTTEELLRPILEKSGLKAGRDFFLAFSPERIDPGRTDLSLEEVPKVVGGLTPDCLEVSRCLNDTGKPVQGSSILVLGVSYKKDVDDVRESPALDIIELLRIKGAEVAYYDPYVPEILEDDHKLPCEPDLDLAVSNADCAIVVTDHSLFDWARIPEQARLLVDTRNAAGQARTGLEHE